ncbi:response regulator transcription factor [Paraburkholderia caballeronis]|uniref:Two component transcriptional regulator, LuxR family n=2 Tax=Paraburkholderia caballeronis TaxID=416943 RepID=A0A1H7VKP9_9BURK|nr:response regulator transcription factor [Paraburkholderia caballeronis]PXW16009.1 LuxR family two component transcriptional regulator [Paraburkholderia caballeronis]PXW93911.1 LuxR family two component transcriptional regulator [Paraburkholderia caballeronis]RAJ89040.1 LuxR family two component transcriptional regulator [Paraburkholderia caballeronis]TDV27726.1 LuxR family two component transcriptional regulator [Paraburkholderia caballeronis]SED89045.1 two component transcriptional regulat
MEKTMKRIVVVDDHPIVVKMLSNVLNADYELVGESGDGEEALHLVQTLKPDLVILDLELPKLDGLSVIRAIRAKHPETRVLVLSAKPEQVMANHTRIAGANGYVSKSRGIEELCSVVRAVLLGYDCFPAGSCDGGRDVALNGLSPREIEVLQYLARGMSNKSIAARLGLSDKTVSTYKTRVLDKLGVSSLAALIEYATLNNLID